MSSSDHANAYFAAVGDLAGAMEAESLDAMARGLAALRAAGGRLFILGVGGGAGHASHAVNDFRKLCHIESYAPTDNVSELTARTNDEGWETSFSRLARGLAASARDALLVFSVGGGSREHNVSVNLVNAMELAQRTRRRDLRRRRRARRRRWPSWPTCAILIDAPADADGRPWSSRFRPSSGTRWSRTPSWPLQPGHWESLAGDATTAR